MIDIFIFAFNRPDLLEIQSKCLKKFLENDFRLNVIHDALTDQYDAEFIRTCDIIKENLDINVRYYKHTNRESLSSSERHSKVLQWAYDTVTGSEVCLFLDHDIFLIEPLNIQKEIENFDIIGLEQTRGSIKYIWPGLVAFKKASFDSIDWSCLNVDGEYLDTGGGTFKILNDSKIRFKNTGVEYPDSYKEIDLKDSSITLGYNFELHYDGKFLHSRNACNWDTQYNLRDQEKTSLLLDILNDVLKNKTKKELEIVVSRYEENLEWTENYSSYCTIYNKGLAIPETIHLENIGREGHTFIKHIVDNYYNLADHTVFLQGDPFNPHSPHLNDRLDQIIESRGEVLDFIWISESIIEGDFEYVREPYHKIFPNIKFAYEKIFGKPPDFSTFKFGAGAQFCVSRKLIQERDISFYENILSLFEQKEKTEDNEKLMNNLGLNLKFHPLNPELGLHLERFWGIIFYQN
jgi:hypothetical protein